MVNCRRCNAEINFIKVRNKKNEIKSVPVNKETVLGIVSTGEMGDKGESIFQYRKVYISHFATCPAAEEYRKNQGTDGKSAEKPRDVAPEATNGKAKDQRTEEQILKDIESDGNEKPPF